MDSQRFTWNEKGELVALSEEERRRQVERAAREFEAVTVTRPEPKMVRLDASPKSVLLAIWTGLMECLEILFQLNRWWPGRKDGPR